MQLAKILQNWYIFTRKEDDMKVIRPFFWNAIVAYLVFISPAVFIAMIVPFLAYMATIGRAKELALRYLATNGGA